VKPIRSRTDLAVGDTVFSKFDVTDDNGTTKKTHMTGVIILVNTNKTYDVTYTDGQTMTVQHYNLTRCARPRAKP
jgi:hypothetical protein